VRTEARAGRSPRHAGLIAILSLSQVVGWGTTYSMVAVLWRPIGADLALDRDVVFVGPTLMLAVAALIAPWIGRALDRRGGREAMMIGVAVTAAGQAAVALSQGWASYAAGWVVIGLGTALVLNQAAFTVAAQVAGDGARRVIGVVALIGALSSTVGWPAAAALDAWAGWRAALWIFAGLHVGLCLPALALLPRTSAAPPTTSGAQPSRAGRLRPEARGRAMTLFAAASAAQGLVSWGLYLNLMTLFEGLGHSSAFALFAATMLGPASIAARFADVAAGTRFTALAASVVAIAVQFLSVAAFPLVGQTAAGAVAVAVLFGASTGYLALARATVPLELFGHAGYGAALGRLAVAQNLAFAASPALFAAAMQHGGADLAIGAAIAFSAVALAGLVALARLAAERPQP
jgi:predicted MFS family arabinose efflux permease